MPLLLGALLIPLGLAFLTNLIQLIQMMNGQNGIPLGVVQPISGTGRRRRAIAAALNGTNPLLLDTIMDIGLLMEKSLDKWLMPDDKQ